MADPYMYKFCLDQGKTGLCATYVTRILELLVASLPGAAGVIVVLHEVDKEKSATRRRVDEFLSTLKAEKGSNFVALCVVTGHFCTMNNRTYTDMGGSLMLGRQRSSSALMQIAEACGGRRETITYPKELADDLRLPPFTCLVVSTILPSPPPLLCLLYGVVTFSLFLLIFFLWE